MKKSLKASRINSNGNREKNWEEYFFQICIVIPGEINEGISGKVPEQIPKEIPARIIEKPLENCIPLEVQEGIANRNLVEYREISLKVC